MSAKRRSKSGISLSHTERGFRPRKTRRQSQIGKGIVSKIFRKRRKQEDKKQTTPRVITGWRLWLFRIFALAVLPVLLLAVVELSLRIVGYGFSPKAIITFQADGKDACCDNVKFGWRFFPRNIARESEPFIFPADKSDDTYRIFVLGASAAQGTPEPAFGFGRILHEMLHDKYPTVDFEIVNTAMTAINSHVVLQVVKDCARHDPDLFIVYLGNNEVTGPYSAGTVYTLPLANLSVIRAGIALKATRLGQLLAGLVDLIGVRRSTPRVWRGLEMFLDNQVRGDSPRLEAVYRNFQRNLEDIRRIAQKSGCKTIFCTVGGNLKDSPPFASLHRPDLTPAETKEWNDIYRQGAEYELLGNYADAIDCYSEAAKIDDRYADLQFRLAQCYWAAAEYEKRQGKDMFEHASWTHFDSALILGLTTLFVT